ncbi:MAG: gliding motility-associated C-terminal domain-containing protein [Bacteroidota bacterium]
MLKQLIYLIGLLFLAATATAQTKCTELGQNPGTAFPVCGTDTFGIASVAICGNRQVPGPCTNVPLTDKNPYWYKFTCFASGKLAFVITPNTISDDYDWQIFDVTNRDPEDLYTDASLFVACNWSGDGGLTGASSLGSSLRLCDGLGVPRFSSMPDLIQGHNYLLLVSHFSDDSQSGYSLSFGGGTASITDPVNPSLSKARAACDGTRISVKLNKRMKCSSVAADGSDFSISPAIAPIIGASGINCSNAFDTDSVVITLNGILPPGNYTVRIEKGTDGNNLVDNCGRGIPAGQTLPVTVFPLTPTPMDSLTKIACAPTKLQLVFNDPMYCNSIAPDGSDFIVTGPNPVSVSAAAGICSTDGFTSIIEVTLSAPIQSAGNYQLQLKAGSDGNTVINECGVETLDGSFLPFTAKDTVSALFAFDMRFGCERDTINFLHDGRNGVNSWKWKFDESSTRSTQAAQVIYSSFGTKQATLIVSNGTCTDTASATMLLDSHVTAAFESTAVVCPGDPASYTDQSSGPVVSWAWTFGNGNVSTLQAPTPQLYPSSNIMQDIPIQLIVANNAGCTDTVTKTIRVVGNCYIAIPKAFSPNGDGLNDFLYPTNAYKARDLMFRVFNRSGQMIFESRDWTNKWDGSYKGNPQDPGTYVWILNYTNIESGKRFELKGNTVLIR